MGRTNLQRFFHLLGRLNRLTILIERRAQFEVSLGKVRIASKSGPVLFDRTRHILAGQQKIPEIEMRIAEVRIKSQGSFKIIPGLRSVPGLRPCFAQSIISVRIVGLKGKNLPVLVNGLPGAMSTKEHVGQAAMITAIARLQLGRKFELG